jgi:cobalt-zinc-cadmium efflux system membrane fusion protein
MYNIKTLFLFATASISVYAFTGCTGKSDAATVKGDDKFQVTDSLVKSLVIDTIGQADALSELTLSGKITPDEDKMVKIFPFVSGIVKDIHVQLGDAIKAGQQLATMKSMEMAGYSKDVIAAGADIKNASRNLSVTNDLYNSGMASQKELDEAKGDYDKAVAEQKRVESVTDINRGSADNYTIKSPIAGFVVEKNITNNMQVRADNTQNLFTIADLSTVWIMANIYESEISRIKVGDDVKVTTLSFPDKVFSGKIDKIYNMLDPDNKVMYARVKISNPGYLLKPEMFANINIRATSGETLPYVNTNSLVFDNDRYYVLIAEGTNKIRIQPVTIAKKIENRAYISEGVHSGDRVIGSRQLFLYESLKD